MIEKGYDPTYGARPMRRAVERYLEDPLAEELLRGNVKAGDMVQVTVENGEARFQSRRAARQRRGERELRSRSCELTCDRPERSETVRCAYVIRSHALGCSVR